MTIDTLGSLAGPRPSLGATDSAPAPQPASRAPATPTETTAAVTAKAETGSMDELKDAIGKLNESMQAQSQSLEFSIDEDSKRTVVKVVDLATKEVVRQIPTEEALQIAKSLDKFTGLLIRQQA
ncbi:flagellar protein FlaG [Pseudoduganella flava]|uniref:Flagellar biosynthesis protein FlaG n=1 Tax=Pseudoduganella flava TaxID=871742 RepID=A0A562PTI1_9BURK|nr:flagellar protein FlaG [Pseudoduganella flava]QGZ39232.1 flagellar biosynthesis protein FlaG [Pseudoduganella flava]TWI47470.1 flagellar protein FlaG [Pseudoduganella flava]